MPIKERALGRQPKASSAMGTMGWIGVERGMRLIVAVAVGPIIGRYLGPADFGHLQVALAWAALLTAIANLGLETILYREFATADPARTRQLFNDAFFLRFSFGLGGALALLVGSFFAHPPLRGVLVAVTCLCFQPAGTITELWLQSKGWNSIAVRIQLGVLIGGTFLRLLMVVYGAPVVAFGALSTVEALSLFALFSIWGRRYDLRPRISQFSWHVSQILLKESLPLFVSVIAAALYQKLDLLLVQRFCTAQEVGCYSVAVRLSEAAYFVPCALAVAAVPRLARARLAGPTNYQIRCDACLSAAVGIGVILSIAFAAGAPVVVPLLYGNQYKDAVGLLQLRGLVLLFLSFEIGRSMRLIQEHKTNLVMLAHIYGAATMIVAGPLLVHRFGALGAAWSVVLATSVPGWLAAWLFHETRGDAYRIAVLFVRPDRWAKMAWSLWQGRFGRNLVSKPTGTVS